jgi:hypothetical protein
MHPLNLLLCSSRFYASHITPSPLPTPFPDPVHSPRSPFSFLLGKRSLETLVHFELDTGLGLFGFGGGGAEDAVGVGDTGANVLFWE